jgi:hypothetical protein
MIRVPDESADRRGVERALRRAYPTGILDEVEVSALDLDLPEARLSALFAEIASLPRLKAVIEVEIVRSHVLHVTSENHPDWEQLNREFTDRERKAAVSAAEGGWLAATRAAGASSPGSVRPSTVYDGLFSDV